MYQLNAKADTNKKLINVNRLLSLVLRFKSWNIWPGISLCFWMGWPFRTSTYNFAKASWLKLEKTHPKSTSTKNTSTNKKNMTQKKKQSYAKNVLRMMACPSCCLPPTPISAIVILQSKKKSCKASLSLFLCLFAIRF